MYSYDVKVLSNDTFLWGGKGIEKPLSSNCLLVCRNDELGVELEIFTKNRTDLPVQFGTLAPGETYIFRLNEITLVGAKSIDDSSDSIVRCTIVCSQSS